jgi:hypothetical protein
MTPDGMTTCLSGHEPKETMERLAAAVTNRGMTILARIDHADAAADRSADLRQSAGGHAADAGGADEEPATGRSRLPMEAPSQRPDPLERP